jgi:hypothetical protein
MYSYPSRQSYFRSPLYTIVALALFLIALAGCGGSSSSLSPKTQSSSAGYNDPNTLAQSIKQMANDKAQADGINGSITDELCILSATPHQFVCNATGSDGSTSTTIATVSADGSSWITN